MISIEIVSVGVFGGGPLLGLQKGAVYLNKCAVSPQKGVLM